MNKKRNKRSERFAVWMSCKGYVKKWLVVNFNSPDEDWQELINLSANKVLHKAFLSHLSLKSTRRDSTSHGRYTARVAIEITEDEFHRYGWELTPTETLSFNALLEREVKTVLHTYNAMLSVTGLTIADRIKRFRKATGITEFDWDTDSIRKELQRNASISGKDDFEKIVKKIEENVWAVLSKSGHITQQGLEEYEKD